ncbi:MAG: LytTR family DNA-binding domain-containing protein [Turicibacter sp.]|nr:LytTR family DNA-binding domain-containing protein [Turicibacter sp.]
MSLFVAICDDEKEMSGNLEGVLINIFDKLNLAYDIDVYATGEEICQQLTDGKHYDLLFLNIEFSHCAINGIEVGHFIRNSQNNHAMAIVYISKHVEFAMQLFDIRPLHFLIKPLEQTKIENIIETYLKLADYRLESFTYKVGHDLFKVKMADIVYVESFDRKLILHLSNDRQEEFYGSLRKIYQEQFAKLDFLFIHANYVVNYDYIKIMRSDKLTLVDGDTTLPISQNRRKEIRTAYMTMEKRRK